MRILCLAVLIVTSVGWAQDAPSHFLIEYELAPGVDITHLSETQTAMVQQHGARLLKLRDEGVVILGGHTSDPQHLRGLVIVNAKDAATARALAAGDPAVRGGIMKTSVEDFALAVPPR
jgi:uncharacterized protein YciI